MFSKMLSIIVILILLVTFNSACNKKDNDQGATTTTTTTTTTTSSASGTTSTEKVDKFENHLTLTWSGHLDQSTLSDAVLKGTEKLYAQKILEERFNVTFEFIPILGNEADQRALMFAEGTYPDFIYSIHNIRKLADDGAIRLITEDMLYDNMPGFMSIIHEYIPDRTDLITQLSHKEGILGIPYVVGRNIVAAGVAVVRKDWLDNVGINKIPETLDEYEEMFRAFSYDDPNKSGDKDTYGYHMVASSLGTSGHYIFGAFGVTPNPNVYFEKNGKIMYNALSDEYRQAYILLSRWYKEGLIDPESITDNRNVQRDKWVRGVLGFIEDNVGWFSITQYGTDRELRSILLNVDDNAELVVLPAPIGPDGKSGAWGEPTLIRDIHGFGRNTTDEQVERIMAIQEELATDQELRLKIRYGIEGEHFYYDELGLPNYMPDLPSNFDVIYGIRVFFARFDGTETIEDLKNNVRPVDKEVFDMAFKQREIIIPRNTISFSYEGMTNEKYNIYSEDVNTLAMEFYSNALVGKVDINDDTVWENFKQSLQQANVQEILDEFQTRYDNSRK